MPNPISPLRLILPRLFLILISITGLSSGSLAAEPLRALLVTGGCCHDYEAQKKIITEGISARANVTWTIVHEGGDTREHMVSIYQKPDWAKGFDVVVHNECFGYVTNVAFVERIAAAHSNGVPAVVLHCSIHSYRMTSTDAWRQVLGVSSYAHERRRTFQVLALKPEHPVMQGFPAEWTDPEDELYQIKKVWPDCVPLAKGIGEKGEEHPCIWVNTCGKGRIFGTTTGHSNDTMKQALYLDLVTRGLLWACEKLGSDGKPKPGYGATAH
jgi:type 1 glutamine amidotransferase